MKILFVCSGNTCRSPMAEGYLNSKKIKNLSALSCGFSQEALNASEEATAVMREIGIDIANHKSRCISPDMLCADKIFCMGEYHKEALISAGVPQEKIFVLGGGISDPYGRDIEVYRYCRDEITAAIDNLLYSGRMLPIKILPAGSFDAKDIANLEKQCFSSPWSENLIIEGLEHNTVFFKAIFSGKFAGHISVTAVAGEGYINNIAVIKEYRQRGCASLLLDRVITFALAQKLDFLSLEVRESNTAAISLYKKTGFIVEGKRKGFYDNPKEDGVIMTRRFKI